MSSGAQSSQSASKSGEGRFFLLDKMALCGIFIGLAGIYAPASFDGLTFAFTAGIGMVFSLVWASEAVRKISKYGLGTGVPSVGMFGIGMGCILALYAMSLNAFIGPVIGLILALVIGWICGRLTNKGLRMNIPLMEKRMAEVTAGSTLAMIASAVVAGGTFRSSYIFHEYVALGIVAVGFIGCAIAIFHAYNANLGPDEAPDRTRMLAVLDGFLLMFVLGIASLFKGDAVGSLVIIFISIVFILISYYKYWTYVKRDAWKISQTGLLPGEEDLN